MILFILNSIDQALNNSVKWCLRNAILNQNTELIQFSESFKIDTIFMLRFEI
jgi:hypothetical protein